MSDVFILGAGFSRAVSSDMPLKMPLVADLANRVEDTLRLNGINHPIFEQFPTDLELWLSYLLDDHHWLDENQNSQNRQIGLRALDVIQNWLFVTEFEMARRSCPKWFTKLVKYWRSNEATVLTLNYGTLVERCAASFKIRCGDLYPIQLLPLRSLDQNTVSQAGARKFKLFKMHGSSTWFHSGSELDRSRPVHYLHYIGWEDEIEDSHELVKGMMPFIVPPRFNKSMYFQHEVMHGLWTLAGDALRKAKRVFVLGYSLPPTDLEMRYFLGMNVRRNQQEVYVFDKNQDVVSRFGALFGGVHLHFNAHGDGAQGPIPLLAEALDSDSC